MEGVTGVLIGVTDWLDDELWAVDESLKDVTASGGVIFQADSGK